MTQGKSSTYEYDAAGNILSKKQYAYEAGTLGAEPAIMFSYTYGDASWGDLLTAYNGQNIRYDTIGNPTTYLGWTLGWTGRSLMSAVKGSQTLSYTYTPDGIRNSKTVNGTKTEYLLNGTQILAQKTGSDVMWFFYDSTGARVGVQQGSITAYYLYNLQGDVVALADAATGKIIATYEYDAWGKCSVTNASGYSIGTANPFRYRGYYYDTETGFYYLNSRYYNPEVGRFLNADAFASTDISDVLSANMFAYCENNAVNCSDPMGHAGIGMMSGWDPREFHQQKEDNSGYKSRGYSVSGGIGLYGQLSYTIIEDDSGNMYQLHTVGIGGGLGLSSSLAPSFIGASASPFPAKIDIQSPYELEGWGAEFGGSLGVISCNTIVRKDSHFTSPSLCAQGADFHALITYTWVVPINFEQYEKPSFEHYPNL